MQKAEKVHSNIIRLSAVLFILALYEKDIEVEERKCEKTIYICVLITHT